MKIIISSRTGFTNKGDEAIFSSMINIFKSIKPKIEIISLSTHPKITIKVHNIPAIWNMNVLKELKIIKEVDFVIIGGGGLLQDIYNKTTIITYLHSVLFAKILKKPVIYYSIGVASIKNFIGKQITRIASRNVDIISVRDEASKKNLIDLGIKKPIQILRDPVFLLKPANKNRIKKILHNEKINILNKPLFALSVRPKNINIKIISLAMDYIINKLNVNVILIPMDPKKDICLAEKISKKMKNKPYILKGNYTPRELLGVIGCTNLLIGMRFHSLVMAAIAGVPMIGIEYEPKIKSFTEYMNLPKPYKIENISTKNLFKQVEYVWNNRINISKRNSQLVKLFQKEILKQTEKILNHKYKKTTGNKFNLIKLLIFLLIGYFYILKISFLKLFHRNF